MCSKSRLYVLALIIHSCTCVAIDNKKPIATGTKSEPKVTYSNTLAEPTNSDSESGDSEEPSDLESGSGEQESGSGSGSGANLDKQEESKTKYRHPLGWVKHSRNGNTVFADASNVEQLFKLISFQSSDDCFSSQGADIISDGPVYSIDQAKRRKRSNNVTVVVCKDPTTPVRNLNVSGYPEYAIGRLDNGAQLFSLGRIMLLLWLVVFSIVTGYKSGKDITVVESQYTSKKTTGKKCTPIKGGERQ